ncbi:transcription factor MYB27-like [Pistacia vera]|uniref:transcription factor MYB27-like n=1 Tax=Pistacia vera TaxID=55513 RepID=UPI0012633873|nr:transcription factor MYB27-like [Pistacia vera]XP_031278848.1 transcription factor MYB27-like [Pistacia vera]
MASQAAMQGEKMRKGPWHEEEDEVLITFVTLLGERRWDYLARASGLKRSGKSCRLRWLNYLRPNIKHGDISIEEEQIILQLHQQWGNKSRIAQRLPGRTDNEIKNYWRTHLSKKMQAQREENF